MVVYFIQQDSSGWITISNVITGGAVLVALLGAIIAWRQLRTMADQMRATNLMALDDRWESDSFKPVRDEMQKLTREVSDAIAQNRKSATATERLSQSWEMYAERLYQLQRLQEPTQYELLLRVCGFFETVGYTANRKYLDVEDVIDLFGGSIRTASQIFESHIRKLQETPGLELQYFYCLWLFDQTWGFFEATKPILRRNALKTTSLKTRSY